MPEQDRVYALRSGGLLANVCPGQKFWTIYP
jgi:hypothetical protein